MARFRIRIFFFLKKISFLKLEMQIWPSHLFKLMYQKVLISSFTSLDGYASYNLKEILSVQMPAYIMDNNISCRLYHLAFIKIWMVDNIWRRRTILLVHIIFIHCIYHSLTILLLIAGWKRRLKTITMRSSIMGLGRVDSCRHPLGVGGLVLYPHEIINYGIIIGIHMEPMPCTAGYVAPGNSAACLVHVLPRVPALTRAT